MSNFGMGNPWYQKSILLDESEHFIAFCWHRGWEPSTDESKLCKDVWDSRKLWAPSETEAGKVNNWGPQVSQKSLVDKIVRGQKKRLKKKNKQAAEAADAKASDEDWTKMGLVRRWMEWLPPLHSYLMLFEKEKEDDPVLWLFLFEHWTWVSPVQKHDSKAQVGPLKWFVDIIVEHFRTQSVTLTHGWFSLLIPTKAWNQNLSVNSHVLELCGFRGPSWFPDSYPRCSMVLEYLPTWLGHFGGKCW